MPASCTDGRALQQQEQVGTCVPDSCRAALHNIIDATFRKICDSCYEPTPQYVSGRLRTSEAHSECAHNQGQNI